MGRRGKGDYRHLKRRSKCAGHGCLCMVGWRGQIHSTGAYLVPHISPAPDRITHLAGTHRR